MNCFPTSRLFKPCILLCSTFLYSLGCSTGSGPDQRDTGDRHVGGPWETHLVSHHARTKLAPRPDSLPQSKPRQKQTPNETIADMLAPNNQEFELAELPDPGRLMNQLAEPVSNPEYRDFLLGERALQQHEIPVVTAPVPGELWEMPEMPAELPQNNSEDMMNDINHPESKDPTLQIDLSAPSLPDDPTDAYMEHLMNEVRRMYAPVPGNIDVGNLRPKLNNDSIEQIREMFGDHPKFQELLEDIQRFQTKNPKKNKVPRNIQQFIQKKRALENNVTP